MILSTKQKIIARTTLFVGILLFSTFNTSNTILNGEFSLTNNNGMQENQDINSPFSSAFWINTSIIIDENAITNTSHSGNWNWAVDQDWCRGEGTLINPYIIENMTFVANSDTDGLLISNSKEIYFTIQNCNFTNAITPLFAGLKFDNTDNGTIFDCNISTNYRGISFNGNSNYNTIAYNTIDDNSNNGIDIRNNCMFNNITYNNVTNSSYSNSDGGGIYIRGNSHFNTITYNNCSENGQGIYLTENENYNFIKNNYCFDNVYSGIFLSACDYGEIQNNLISNNDFGININSYSGIGTNFFDVSFNTVESNSKGGIFLYASSSNEIYNNSLSQNAISYASTYGGITIREKSNYNYVYNNTASQSNLFMQGASHNNIINNTFTTGSNGLHIYSNANNNSFVNNTVENYSYGFRAVGNRENNLIDNDFINCNDGGIRLSNPSNYTINNNLITGSNRGIFASGTGANNTLVQNQILAGNTIDIEIKNSDYWNLTENVMENKGLLIADIYHNQIDTSNTLQGKPIYYYEDQNNLNLNGDIDTDMAQLFIINTTNSVISNFDFNNLPVGIYIDQGNLLSISNNNVSNNDQYGLYLNNINASSIIDNIASNCNNYGILANNLNQNIIDGNTICNNNYGIYNENDDPDDWDDENPDVSSLMGENIFSQNIVNNNNHHGIEIRYSKSDIISNNEIKNNSRDGIYIEYVHNCIISNNQINDNSIDGIGLYYAPDALIIENQLSNNTIDGMYLENSNTTTIQQNNIELSYTGISLYDSHQTEIEENTIISNSHYGIYFEIANETLISSNIIEENGEIGILVDSESYNNMIYQNIFIQNTIHAEDNGIDTQWDFNNVGNYWDNFTGSDLNTNGIGDSSQPIIGSAVNSDLYPIYNLAPVFVLIPQNATFIVNQSQIVNWTIQDYIVWDTSYIILINGTEFTSGTWESGTQLHVNLQLLNLEPGNYSLTIIAYDGMGYATQDTIIVVINPELEGDSDPHKISGFLVFLLVVLGLALISVSSMAILKKKNPAKYEEIMGKLKEIFGKIKNIGKSDRK